MMLRFLFSLATGLLVTGTGIASIPQMLQWGSPNQPVLPLGTGHRLEAEASSGLPVEFRVVKGPAVIRDGMLWVTNVDVVTVVAEQPGNGDFDKALVMRTFNEFRVELRPMPGSGFGRDVNAVLDAGRFLVVSDALGGFRLTTYPRNGFMDRMGEIRTDRLLTLEASGYPAFAGFASSGLRMVNLEDPGNPRFLAGFSAPDRVVEFARSGSLVIAAFQFNQVVLIDAGNPANVSIIGRYEIPWVSWEFSEVRSVAVVGNRLYLAIGGGIHVLDISNPRDPRRIGALTFRGISQLIGISSSRLVAAHRNVLRVFDVQNPTRIHEIGSHRFRGGATGISTMRWVGGLLYLADVYGNIEVLGLREPAVPEVLGRHENWLQHAAAASGPLWISSDGDRLVAVGTGRGVHTLQVQRRIPQHLHWESPDLDRVRPGTAGGFKIRATSGLPVDIAVESGPARWEDGQLFVTNQGPVVLLARQQGTSEISPVTARRVVNATEIESHIVGRIPIGGRASSLVVTNGHAFVARYGNDVDVFDIRDPARPARIGTIPGTETAYHLLLDDGLLLATGGGVFQLVSVDDPTQPRLRGSLKGLRGSYASARAGSHVLIADGPDQVQVVDISNPDQPRIVGSIGDDSPIVALTTQDGVLATVTHAAWLTLWDVRNPLNSRRLSKMVLPGYPQLNQLQVTGNHLVIGVGPYSVVPNLLNGVYLLDLSDPSNPPLIGHATLGGAGVHSLSTRTPWAFAGTMDDAVQILDLRDPANPRVVGKLPDTLQVLPDGDLWVTVNATDLVLRTWREATRQELVWPIPAPEPIRPGIAHPLGASATSGLPVEYRVLSGPGRIENGHLIVDAGVPTQSIVVQATQKGNDGIYPVETLRVFNPISVDFKLLGEVAGEPASSPLRISNSRVFYGIRGGAAGALRVQSVGDLNELQAAREFPIGNGVLDAAMDGDLACVTTEHGSFHVLRLGEGEGSGEVGRLDLGIPLGRIAISGAVACLATGSGLQVVDLADPGHPRLVGQLGPANNHMFLPSTGLLLQDGYAYATEATGGFSVTDVRIPERPVLVGWLPDLVGQRNPVLDGQRILISGAPLGFQAVDVSDPTRPTLQSRGMIGSESWSQGLPFGLWNGVLVCADSSALRAADPGIPAPFGVMGDHEFGNPGVRDMTVEGDRAFVMATEGTLQIFQLRAGVRRPLDGLRIPQHGESGQVLQLPSETGFGHLINYTMISGAASISGDQLSLEGVGPVTLRATLVDMEGFLPSETTRTVLAEAILLSLSRNAADGSLRLGWRLDSDLLETAPSLDGPWVPVPEARSPYHPAESGPSAFYRIRPR
ncbi:MAG: hypothetical protein KF791_02095 [Verrucomicrobiae bacterium]|nr:hypothetical protein [Verrucomicrobiae bacterium]